MSPDPQAPGSDSSGPVDQEAAPEADVPQLFQKIWLFDGDGPPDTIERLKAALARAIEGAQALAMFALAQPAQVRGGALAGARPVRLAVPKEASDLLGPRMETHIVVEAGRTRFFLAGTERVAAGATVTLVAATVEGEVTTASAVVDEPGAPLELELERGEPEAIILAVSDLLD
jgi:hypothetical protein